MALKLIGAGLGRTGTGSLKLALEQLGLGRCYHMTEIMHNPEYIPNWIDAADGNPDWETIYKDYGATVDYPGCTFYKELADHYPDAKVLLTVRDANKWFESTNETILSPKVSDFIRNSPWGHMIQKTIWNTLDNRMQDRDFMVSYYKNRNQEVIDSFPPERLLVYEVKEGWAPLCEFLEVPIPDTDFPRINSREETKELFAQLIAAQELSEEGMAKVAEMLHGDSLKGEP
ncbi:MAG: hypothetical protein O3C43_14260 [Verrucomicrobia bacterium]|nr:hypothetical protein [Verrucomicrobiota bacterium]MDA1067654.1 hypothetical protein [Verrucomicrobiota bacterium]